MTAKDELLKVLLDAVLKADEAEGEEGNEDPKPKTKTEAEIRAEVEAELIEKAKAAAKAEAEKKDDDDDGDTDDDDSEDDALTKQVRESINDKVKLALNSKNIDSENFEEISKFLEYGTLRGEDGLADGEKINDFVDTLASVALRQPPKSKDNKTFDPSAQGLAKYLK